MGETLSVRPLGFSRLSSSPYYQWILFLLSLRGVFQSPDAVSFNAGWPDIGPALVLISAAAIVRQKSNSEANEQDKYK